VHCRAFEACCHAVAFALALAALPVAAAAAETETLWHEAYNSRVRLIAGTQGDRIVAGVDIELAEGWKTYWRQPGDSGGVPPSFDWAKSDNLQSAVPLYPAPRRLPDGAGDAIGYTGRVIFPVRIVAADASRPVTVGLQLEYGICREICVPVEASLQLSLPAGFAVPLPQVLATAIDQVPRLAAARRPNDPKVLRTEARLAGATPRLEIDVEYPGGLDGADAFIEAPDGIYVPQPLALGEGDKNRRSYVVDLRTGVEPADLKGKRLTLTLVGEAGQSQADWLLD
jgi:DsbC/DsbD-like thiol-disulfide interchange protein